MISFFSSENLRRDRRVIFFTVAPFAILLLVLLGFVGWQLDPANKDVGPQQQLIESIELPELLALDGSSLTVGEDNQLLVNGELRANGAFILKQGEAPTNPVAGSVYFDQASGTIRYYDGRNFVDVASGENICYLDAEDNCGFATAGDAQNLDAGVGLSLAGATLSNTGDLNGADDLTVSTLFGGDVAGTFSVLQVVANAIGSTEIQDGSVQNADLANSSIVVAAGTGLNGGGAIALGGTVTLGSVLGTDIDTTEIADNTILAADLNSGTAPGVSEDGYTLTYDHATGGFEWMAVSGGSGGITSLNGLVTAVQAFANDTNVTISSSGSTHTLGWSGQLAVGRGGTGASSFTVNGVLYGDGTNALQSTAAGSAGQVLLANASGVPTFITISSDATLAATGALTINPDAVALGTDTTGNYVATISAGNGISGAASSEGATPTIALSALTANWNQSGAFDIVLNNTGAELSILDSDGTHTGTLDVANLAQNTTYLLPATTSASVSLCTSDGNCPTGITSLNGVTATTQTFTTGTAGADFNISSAGSAHTFNIPNASATARGLVTAGTQTIAGNKTLSGNTTLNSTNSASKLLIEQAGGADILTVDTTNGDVELGDGSTQGVLLFNSGTSGVATLRANSGLAASATFELPSLSAGTYTLCTTSGNCLGGGSGGANTALSNLSGVAINTSLLPGSAGTINLGSSTLPFRDLTLAGSSLTPGANNFTVTGTATAGRTITLPDANGTVCLSTGNCIGGSGGASNAAAYITVGNDAGLTAERAIAAGTNLTAVDGGANGSYTLNVANNPTFSGLVTLNGNVLLQPGDTITVNGDAFTDFTGTGLTISSGQLQVVLGTDVNLASSEVTGVLGATNGGTGLSAYTTGDLIYASASNTLSRRAIGTTNQCLIVSGGVPTWGSCTAGGGITSLNGLTTASQTFANDTNVTISSAGSTHTLGWSGQLAVGRGGTGSASFTANGVLYGNGTSAIAATAAGTTGQCLVATTGSAPTWGSCAGSGSGVTLQAAYNNSTNPEITLDATRGALTLRDNATPLGANLLEVQNNAGTTTYFAVNATGTTVNGTLSVGAGGLVVIDSSGNIDLTNTTGIELDFKGDNNTNIYSEGSVVLEIDSDNDGANSFIFQNGTAGQVAQLNENALLRLGNTALSGSLQFYDGTSNSGTIYTTALGADRTYTLPDEDGAFCLTSGNCAGVGGTGDITGTGAANQLAYFNGTKNITSSSGLTFNGSDLAVDTNTLYVDAAGNRVGIGDATPTNTLDVTGSIGISDTTVITGGRALQNVTGITSSGTVTFSGLAANRLVATTTGGQLTNSISASNLLSSVSGTTGTAGNLVFSVSPTFTGTLNAANVSATGTVTLTDASTFTANSSAITLGNGAADTVTTRGLINLSSASGHEIEGLITLGRIDGTARNQELVYYNSSTTANNYFGVNLHTGALSTTQEALRLYGDGELTVGNTSLQGSLSLFDGSSNTGTLQTTALGSNRTYTFPDESGTVCLTSGNCVGGGGGGAIGGSGTLNTIAMFTPDGNNIGNSVITQSSGNITVGGSGGDDVLEVVGGNLDISTGNLELGNITVITSGRAIQNATGITSSGTVTFSGLTANRLVSTTTGGQLTNSITAANLLSSVSGTTGTGNLVFATSPTVSTLTVSSGGIAVTGNSTINGTLSSLTGYSQSSGNFAISGSGTFSTGTGTVSLNGNTSITGSNTLTVGTGATSLGGTLAVAGVTSANGGLNTTYTRNTAGEQDSGGASGWRNIGTFTGTTGARFEIKILGSQGYGQTQSNHGETIIIGSLGNNTNGTIANAQGSWYSVGGNAVLADVKFVENGSRNTYDVYADFRTFSRHSLSVQTSLGTWTNAWTSVSDPGANSATVQQAVNTFDVTASSTNLTSTLSVSGAVTLSNLTADRLVATTTGGQLTNSISAANLQSSVSGTTGSGNLVFATSPSVSTLTVSSGNLAITSGNLTTNGTTRLTNAGVLQNVTNANAGTFFTGGALTAARGGTGQSSYTAGDLLYASGATTLSKLGVGSNGQCLTVAAGLPAWSSCGTGLFTDAGAYTYLTDTTDNLIIGDTSNDGGKLRVESTTEQLRLSYNNGSYASFTLDGGGDLTIDPTGFNTDIDGTLTLTSQGTFNLQDFNGSTTTTTTFFAFNGAGDNTLQIDPKPATTGDTAYIRLFRGTNGSVDGSGNHAVLAIFRGDNSLTVNHQLAGQGNTYLAGNNGNVAIGKTSAAAQKLDVNGTIRQTGCTTSGTLSANGSGDIICTSDERLKTVYGNYTGGLDQLRGVQTINFSYLGESYVHNGFSAQNLAQNIPQAAPLQPNGYYGLDANAVLATTVNAIQQLDQRTTQLQQNLQTLQNQLNNLDLSNLNTVNANTLTTQTLTVSGTATIATLHVTGSTTIDSNLTVKGDTTVEDIYVNGHIVSGGNIPQIASGAQAGSNASVSIEGNDTAGTVTITTGSGAATGELATITFNAPYSKAPRITLTPINASSAQAQYYVERSLGSFQVRAAGGVAPGTTYVFDYQVIE